jgi:hypothetical protein
MTTSPIAVTRETLLSRSGKLREDYVDVDELGRVYCRELSGQARAELIEGQAKSEGLDLVGYQKKLLLGGLFDPESPEGARTSLLEEGDLDAVMQVGSGSLDLILEKIETLSGLGVKAKENAEKSLGEAPSASSTSELPES